MPRRRQPDPGPEVELPVTPMLDMAFQLLTFFVFTYHPSALEGQLDLSLPAATSAAAAAPDKADPTVTPASEQKLELPAEITVIVRTQHDGTNDGVISQLAVVEAAGEKTLANPPALLAYLRDVRGGLTNQEDIKIQADSGLKYGAVTAIMDLCIKAGFKNVGFAPPPEATGG